MSGFNIKSNLSAWICTFFVQAVFSQLKRIPTLLVISKKKLHPDQNTLTCKLYGSLSKFRYLKYQESDGCLERETWVTRQVIISFLYLYKWSNFTFCLFVKIPNLKDLYWTSTRVKSQRLVGLGNKFLKQTFKKIGLICQRKTVGLFQCDIIPEPIWNGAICNLFHNALKMFTTMFTLQPKHRKQFFFIFLHYVVLSIQFRVTSVIKTLGLWYISISYNCLWPYS